MPRIEPNVLETESGLIRGTIKDGMLAFLGVPYAAAPLGALRWKPPQATAKWDGVRDCAVFGNDSLQDADLGVFARAGGDEDCLYLNVYKAQSAEGTGLPVMVWIHGGATRVGTGRDYDPSKFVQNGSAIVVTLNYRLGILGYFAHPDLTGTGEPTANFGMLDQQMALSWVQRNIAAFGGDPENVTIFGESTGGNSVLGHLVSPLSKGKFSRAIVMSGGAVLLKNPVFGAPVPLEIALDTGKAFAEALNCKSVNELRALPSEALLAAQGPYVGAHQYIIDGHVIPEHPADCLRTGRFNRVPIICGHTADEGRFFAGLMENMGAPMDVPAYEAAIRDQLGTVADQVLDEYRVDDFDSPAEAFAAVMTDFMFACTSRRLACYTGAFVATFVYEFADKTAPSYLQPTSFPLGAGHTCELPYLFEGFCGGAGLAVALNPMQERLSEVMVAHWLTHGSRSGQPSEWTAYDPDEDNVLVLALPEPRLIKGRSLRAHRYDFWESLGIYG